KARLSRSQSADRPEVGSGARPERYGHGSRMRLRISAKARPARRPIRFAVDSGSLTRPASKSANQARNFASSAGGSRRIASSTSSAVMTREYHARVGGAKHGGA